MCPLNSEGYPDRFVYTTGDACLCGKLATITAITNVKEVSCMVLTTRSGFLAYIMFICRAIGETLLK